MDRTRVLSEVRVMRFEEIVGRLTDLLELLRSKGSPLKHRGEGWTSAPFPTPIISST